jgi:hypothetical protein
VYRPERWALRILQETVDTTRFASCGYNTYSNNIIVIDDRVTTECNIGPNTAPETFAMSNNFWLHIDEFQWDGPVLPVADPNIIVQQDPLFMDEENDNFDLEVFSPAIGAGLDVASPEFDYLDRPFNSPRSIGAFEGNVITALHDIDNANNGITVYPMPATDYAFIQLTEDTGIRSLSLYSMEGILVKEVPVKPIDPGTYYISLHQLPAANYVLKATLENDHLASAILQIN